MRNRILVMLIIFLVVLAAVVVVDQLVLRREDTGNVAVVDVTEAPVIVEHTLPPEEDVAVMEEGETLDGAMPPIDQALLDAMYDEIGVTRWAEAIGWLELLETQPELMETVVAQTPVWIARQTPHHFHSNPLCGNLSTPVRTTYEQAVTVGLSPCTRCWKETEQ